MKVRVQVYHTYPEMGSLLMSLCGLSHEGTCSGLSHLPRDGFLADESLWFIT